MLPGIALGGLGFLRRGLPEFVLVLDFSFAKTHRRSTSVRLRPAGYAGQHAGHDGGHHEDERSFAQGRSPLPRANLCLPKNQDEREDEDEKEKRTFLAIISYPLQRQKKPVFSRDPAPPGRGSCNGARGGVDYRPLSLDIFIWSILAPGVIPWF
jgi:hypothetical protein